MADITKHTLEDLHKEITEKREALRAFRFGSAGSRTRNTREGRNLRKDIARRLTEMNARKGAASKEKVAKSEKTA